MGSKLIVDNEFYCVKCSRRGIPIARKKGAEREAGHLKKLYCLNCKMETNHAECRPWSGYTYEDFLLEFNNHNFDEDGNRILTLSEFRSKINNERNKA